MSMLSAYDPVFSIPVINGLADFRRWAQSSDFPETGRIDYLAGRIEVDMSPEDLYCHNQLKVKLIAALVALNDSEALGELYSDRVRVSDPGAAMSVEPDIVFISELSLDSGRVRLVPKASGETGRFVELEGAPDLIIEIVSDSSETKDRRRLAMTYFEAGVTEYWLIDARKPELEFNILRRGYASYEASLVDVDGFVPSNVLRRRFHIERTADRRGNWKYQVLVRPHIA